MNVSLPQLQVGTWEYELSQVDPACKASVHNPLGSQAGSQPWQLQEFISTPGIPSPSTALTLSAIQADKPVSFYVNCSQWQKHWAEEEVVRDNRIF